MIRRLKQEEAEAYLNLVQIAFNVSFNEKIREQRTAKFNPEEVWGYYVDGELAAMLSIIPLQVYIEGQAFVMGGIAQVANYPEHRRQGMVGRLLVNGLQAMKEAGQTISLLNPFLFSVYRKYGWDYFAQTQSFQIETPYLPRLPQAPGKVQRKKPDEVNDMVAVYNEFAKRYNGMLVRDEDWVRQHVLKRTPGTVAVYYGPTGRCSGYMLYSFQDKIMRIHELVSLDEEAERGLWQFIGNHDSTIQGVELKTPSQDPIVFRFDNPILSRTLEMNYMARIVDAEAFMRQYPWKFPDGDSKYVLHLSDTHAPWNNGTFEVGRSGTGETTVIRRTNRQGLSDDIPDGLSCDIQTLSTLLIGCQRPERLHELGRLLGKKEEAMRWGNAVTSKVPFILDLF